MPELTPDLAELERLLAEATPRPWQTHLAFSKPFVIYGPGDRWLHSGRFENRADAPLIVAAVNALPALLAEREKLREALSIAMAELDEETFIRLEAETWWPVKT